MHMISEDHFEESLRNISQGVEQMITAVSRHATEDEREFQFEEQLEEAGDMLARGIIVKLS